MIQPPLEQSLWDTKVSQPFGVYQAARQSRMHNGVDHAVPIGTPLHAVCDGFEVYQVIPNRGTMGHACYARFEHNGRAHWLAFLHLSQPARKGVYKAGDVFAYTGNTGDSTGPHSHIEKWKVPVDRNLLRSKVSVLANLEDPMQWFKAHT